MDGKMLIDSIADLRGKQLRITYALFNETNLLHDFQTALLQKLSRNKQDVLEQTLDKIINSLKHRTDEELQLELIESMSKCVDVIPRRNFTSSDVLFEEGNDIVFKTLEIARKHDRSFKGVTLNDFLEHQISKIFGAIDKEFEKDPDKVTDNLHEAISEFSPEMVQEMKDALNVNEFSKDVLRNVMRQSGSAVLFSAAVNLSGFAFYTTASTLLAWITGVFGVGLPFAAYIGLSTTIAFLSGPIFLAIIAAISSVYLIHGNSKRQERLLPELLAQIVLTRETANQIHYEYLIQQWKQVSHNYQSLEKEQVVSISKQDNLRDQIIQCSSRLDELKVVASDSEKKQFQVREDVRQRLSKENCVESWRVDDEFHVLTLELSRCRLKTTNLRMEVKNKTSTFFSGVRHSLELATIGPKIMSHQREEQNILNKMVESLMQKTSLETYDLASTNKYYIDLHKQYLIHLNDGARIHKEQEQLNAEMNSLRNRLSVEKNDYNKRLTQINILKKRHPRLQYIS